MNSNFGLYFHLNSEVRGKIIQEIASASYDLRWLQVILSAPVAVLSDALSFCLTSSMVNGA